jgi:cation diffusion facilitator CzcD-associated flavoprotein CzcO
MTPDYEIGVVGAGFGGIIAGISLLRSNRKSFVVFEKSKQIGGVWRDNIYPGCACDIRSNLYSIKSEPNPNWSASYPNQNEILQYLTDVVRKHKLETFIQYDTEITEMRFIEKERYWLVTDTKNRCLKIKMLILATGPFRLPHIPDIPGRKLFRGQQFHSSCWDNRTDLSGLSVAVIGTGASSAQIIPNIAEKVARLFVFQRSPAWVLPRWDHKNSAFIKKVYKRFPFIQQFHREINYWFLEFIGLSFLGRKKIYKWLSRIALNKLNTQVLNPEIRAELTPQYSFGCKRVIVSDNFYPIFNRSNVTLVADSITEITESKICTIGKKEFLVDIIIYANGFKVADIEQYIQVIGRNNRLLNAEWDINGAEAYLGINVSGYPNLCFLLGPNSGLSHSSALHIIESQMTYILKYLSVIEEEAEQGFLDVKSRAQKLYNLKLQEKLKSTIWSSGCNSWFINKNRKNVVIYPDLTFRYRKQTKKLNLFDYSIYGQEKNEP